MDFEFKDYNGFGEFAEKKEKLIKEIDNSIKSLPIYLKKSYQKDKTTLIFNPVGTNKYFAKDLVEKNWSEKAKIRKEYKSLGSDVDFFKEGVIVEVQFSNYPYLLNNSVRSQIFIKNKLKLNDTECDSLVIITKVNRFNSSNSTLSFEKAKMQLDILTENELKIINIPMRLIGLKPNPKETNTVIVNKYKTPRAKEPESSEEIENVEVSEPKGKYIINT